jgi:hypothetical protein
MTSIETKTESEDVRLQFDSPPLWKPVMVLVRSKNLLLICISIIKWCFIRTFGHHNGKNRQS